MATANDDKKNFGELNIEALKTSSTDTKLRISTDINNNEKDFKRKRAPRVASAIQHVLGNNGKLQSADQVPEISVVGSGGGYRAVIGMSGGMQALKDNDLLDVITYVSGLSGSAWYLTSAFAHGGISSNGQEAFHKIIKKACGEGLKFDFLKRVEWNKWFRGAYGKVKEQHKQPISVFVDSFGEILGEHLLGERRMELGISSFRSQVSEGEVPYPILTSMHVKSKTPSYEFYAYVENTPYEISLPSYGINMTPEVFGSHWKQGVLSKKCPEFPLHFYLASCGCAFAILASYAKSEAGEEDAVVVDYINGMRITDEESKDVLRVINPQSQRARADFPSLVEWRIRDDESPTLPSLMSVETTVDLEKHEPTSDLNEKLRQLDEEYLARSRLSDVAEKTEYSPTSQMLDGENAERLERRKSIIQKEVLDLLPEGILEDFKEMTMSAEEQSMMTVGEEEQSMMTVGAVDQLMMTVGEEEQSMMTVGARCSDDVKLGRNFLFDRTAVILNFAHTYDDIKVMKTPSTEVEDLQNEQFQSGSRQAILREIVFREAEPMTTEADNISVIDAGILKNVSLECVLRPERRSDLIIVFDMNAYTSDSYFNYWPLVKTAVHAWKDGLKFPNINLEELVNSPPQELLTFESDADDCPTIMWFTLSNKKFKEHKDYVPRSTAKPPRNNSQSFNDFPVFDKGTKYGTFEFGYSAYEFDQLHELMYYNVDSHVKDIKEQIVKAIARKLRRLSSSS